MLTHLKNAWKSIDFIPLLTLRDNLRIPGLETPDLEVRQTIFSLDDPDTVSMLTSICPAEMLSSETPNPCQLQGRCSVADPDL